MLHWRKDNIKKRNAASLMRKIAAPFQCARAVGAENSVWRRLTEGTATRGKSGKERPSLSR